MTDINNHAAYRSALLPGFNEETPDDSPQINAQPGAVSMNEDGTTTTRRPTGLNTADFGGPGEGILSTLRTRTGSPRMGPVEGTDTIRIDGMEMQVQTAEGLGILKRDAQGNYTEVQGGLEAAADEKAEEAPAEPDGEALADTAVEADLSELVGSVSAGLQVAALLQIVKDGAPTPNIINAAASEARVEPSAMNARVHNVMEAFRAQAVTTVQGYGAEDAEGFFDWAKAHKRADFDKAMQTHGMERSTKGYEPIYQEYVSSIATREPDRVLNAEFGGGITARLDDRKNVVLNIPGKGEMLYAVALKSGLIKVSRA